MAWAAIRRSVGAWLALTALALQLAVSFGHIHAEDFVRGHYGLTIVADAATDVPDDPDNDHLDCAICATVHLASVLLLPAPPAISLPADIAVHRPTAGEQDTAQRARALAFDARGPPRT